MSVIAKLSVQTRADYGVGSYIHLNCVASNEVMAAYAGSEEGRLFSRYSPSGEIKINQAGGWSVFPDPRPDEHVRYDPAKPWVPPMFYVMLVGLDEVETPDFGDMITYTQAECYSVSRYAYDGSRVELRDVPGWAGKDIKREYRDRAGVIERLSWKMHVDNPGAEAQFKPGRKYWVIFYPVEQFTRDQAIARAHGQPAADDSVAATE